MGMRFRDESNLLYWGVYMAQPRFEGQGWEFSLGRARVTIRVQAGVVYCTVNNHMRRCDLWKE